MGQGGFSYVMTFTYLKILTKMSYDVIYCKAQWFCLVLTNIYAFSLYNSQELENVTLVQLTCIATVLILIIIVTATVLIFVTFTVIFTSHTRTVRGLH